MILYLLTQTLHFKQTSLRPFLILFGFMEEITPSKDATSAAKVLHAWRDLLEANDPKMLRASDEDLTKPRTELDGPKMHMYIHI